MMRKDMVELVEHYTASWNDCDADAVAACFSEDAVNRDIAVRVPLQGREQIKEVAARFMDAFPDLSRAVSRIVCENDLMTVEWRITGTHEAEVLGIPATGRHVEIDGCSIARVDADGLICALTNHWDVAGLLHQIGDTPEPTHVPQAAAQEAHR